MSSYRAILPIVVALLLVVATNSSTLRRRARKPSLVHSANNEIDHYVLAQAVPQAQCYLINRLWKDENSTCSPCAETWTRNDRDWALHGLWPNGVATDTSPGYLGFCNDSVPFDSSLLDGDLRNDLEYHWTDMKKAANQDAFWRHEWDKHGTCALHVKSLSGVRNYFQGTIDLLQRYNVGHYLEAQGIVPGNEYDLDEFSEALFKAYGVRSTVKCSQSPMTGKQYVNEVWMCLDKSFKAIDCKSDLFVSCDKKSKIMYAKNANQCSKYYMNL